MKKIVSCSIVALVSTVMLVSSTSAQDLALNSSKEQKIFSTPKAENPSGEICSIDNVNKKVLKSFHRLFGEKSGAVWFKSAQGFVVHFKSQNKATNAYFSTNGTIDYQVDYYFEDALPRDVRHTVKSNYDYSITHVSEVRKNDFVCYFVKVEDKTCVKTIKVTGDEYAVVENLTKR